MPSLYDELSRLETQHRQIDHQRAWVDSRISAAEGAIATGDASAVAQLTHLQAQRTTLDEMATAADASLAALQREIQDARAAAGARLAYLAQQAAGALATYEQTALDAAPVVHAALTTMIDAYRVLVTQRLAFLDLLRESPIDAGTLLADLERNSIAATALCAPWLGTPQTQQVVSYVPPSPPPFGHVLYAEVDRLLRAEVEALQARDRARRFARGLSS